MSYIQAVVFKIRENSIRYCLRLLSLDKGTGMGAESSCFKFYIRGVAFIINSSELSGKLCRSILTDTDNR